MSNYRIENVCGNLIVAENKNYQWGVVDKNGNEVVPFGKYAWISQFDRGYARVKSIVGKGHWHIGGENFELETFVPTKFGIIDMTGKEVVPMEYDNIWNFYNKGFSRVRLEKDNVVTFFDLTIGEILVSSHSSRVYSTPTYTPKYYKKYSGSYAQDVMGYDDYTIDEAFDGDPEAYWNID